MRCLVDMALSPGLADWLVQRGHDAVHASTIGLARAADTEVIEQALRLGARAYMKKPFDFTDLQDLVARALQA